MRIKGLQMRISFWAGLCFVITAGIIIAYSARLLQGEAGKARALAITQAKLMAMTSARRHAGYIKADLEVALDAARTLAQSLSSIKLEENAFHLSRDNINNILKNILRLTPEFVGVYTCWEPGKFDDYDKDFINKPGHDKTGRFIPYWNRSKDGKIVVEPLVDYQQAGPGDYYQLPKKRQKECIIDPYIYPVQDEQVLITSLVVPIMANGEFYGITGVDLRIDNLQKVVDDVKDLYEGSAEIQLLSSNLTVAAITRRPEAAGKPLSSLKDEDLQEDMPILEKNVENIWLDENSVKVFVPIEIGDTETPWFVKVTIPMKEITRHADKLKAGMINDMGVMVSIGLVCTIVGLVLLWLITRNIVTPLKEGIETMQNNAGRVISVSAQVMDASRKVAHTASEQAERLKQNNTALNSVSVMIRQNSKNAENADQMMLETTHIAEKANTSMKELIGAMSEISEASRETSDIIKIIDEIAFQTNLLALNAAVEAARAGEAGLGFAVVAGEVKNLAGRSAEAAGDTSQRIEQTLEKISEGGEMLSHTDKFFTEVVDMAKKAKEAAGNISEASQTQAVSVEEILTNSGDMADTTRQNKDNAEEFAAASQQLNTQAEEMQCIVKKLTEIIEG